MSKNILFNTYFLVTVLFIVLLMSFFTYRSATTNLTDTVPTKTNDLLKSKLTKMQYYVTQENGTEPAFQNKYFDSKKPGIYVDVVSGQPLFSSTDKYDSSTGWPSFTKPIDQSAVTQHKDTLLGVERIEIRSTKADSHLGHLFDDGPAPSNNRYCINSAALRFVPKNELEAEGYSEYLQLFVNS